MGRSRRGSGSGFSKPAAAAPSRPAAPPPHHSAPPPAHHQQAGGMPAMGGGRGPGLMGMMGASMVGSMAGNAIANHMFSSAPQPTSEEGVKEMKQVMDESPCAVQFDMYAKCMDHNNADAAACQWAWDSVSQCRTRAMQQAGQGPQA
jgi:hypothetical protein